MHTFRFNPVFNRWVVLGTSLGATPQISEVHLLDDGRRSDFLAAHHPAQPFVLEPGPQATNAHSHEVFASQPPVGEYEFLLYRGEADFFTWKAREWEGWLSLFEQRIRQLQHNPYLHFVHLAFNTATRHGIHGYQRVGDLIATSHPITGLSTLLDIDMAEKLHRKEKIFLLHEDEHARVLVPSAPLHDRECWLLPTDYSPCLLPLDGEERRGLADVLSLLLAHLKEEFPHDEYEVHVHTALGGSPDDHTWWIQLFKAEGTVESALPVRPLPEFFMHKLRQTLR